MKRTALVSLSALLLLPLASLHAADPALEAAVINIAPGIEYADKTRIFQGIPGIERAANGRLWALWYAGGPDESGEGPGNYVVLVTSGDDGKTWSGPKLVIDPPGAVRAYDPTLWHDPDGRLWLFWAQSNNFWDGRSGVWCIVSENSGDGSPKWSNPRRIGNGIMMNKPTVLSTGEWLLPISVWPQKASTRTAPEYRHDLPSESGANAWVTKDRGKTFSMLGQAIVPKRGYDEHMIVEQRDGGLWMLVRTAIGIGESRSTDRGKTWAPGWASDIPHVASRFFIRRLQSGKLLLVKHNPPDKKTRSHLMAHLSNDDGKTWSTGLMIDERAGVSYPDGVQAADGVIYLIYDYARQAEKQIFMATFTESDVSSGTWQSAKARQRVLVNQATGMRQAKAQPGAKTAWNEGYPKKGLKNADEFVAGFKNKAQHLGKDGQLRILIIGDSLSDGGYHWSHHFRKNLQAAYGDGGPGAIWSTHAGPSAERGTVPGWLWSEKDFISYKGPNGRWRNGWGSRGDIWPYLGWNGNLLTTSDPQSSYELVASGSKFTVVYSTGTFNTFDGEQIKNRSAGFTVALDDQKKVIAPAKDGAPIDIGLAKFAVPDGQHMLRVNAVHDGNLWLSGVIVEKSTPGIIVNNISRGGYWAHNFIWRQPGWEKILQEFQPDYTIIFITKPESGGSGPVSNTNRLYEYERLVQRVKGAVPKTQIMFFNCWNPRDGINAADAQTSKERLEWFEAKRLPYLDLQSGLDRQAMKDLGWFNDNIHLAPPGGQGIGEAITRLFLP